MLFITLLCLYAVTDAFSTAKWTEVPEDVSTLTFPAWSDFRQCSNLSDIAALMSGILQSGSKSEQDTVAMSASLTNHNAQMPNWPASSKEWASMCVVVTRAAAVLEWILTRMEPQAQDAAPAAPDQALSDVIRSDQVQERSSQLLLMQNLLQLLDTLLTGKRLALAGYI